MKFMMLIKHPKDYDIRDVPPALSGPMGEFVAENMKNGTILMLRVPIASRRNEAFDA